MNNRLDRHNGFPATDWAIYLDSNKYDCRGIDTVDQWVREWDGVDAPLALWSFATDTHSYVKSIKITGRTCQFPSCDSARLRVRVTFADPEVGTMGGWLIRVGGKFFVSEEARQYFHS